MPYDEEDEGRILAEMQWMEEQSSQAEAEANAAQAEAEANAAQAEAEALAAGGEG